MSSAFGILPASTSIALDGTRHGSASFTVTNQLARPVRVRVAVTPAGDPAPPLEWLTPPPVPERDLALDGSEQFTVLVDVPVGSAGGTYNFRLDAVSVELPDEEWAHSPAVHFVVPEPEQEPVEEPVVLPAPKGYIETAAGALLGGFAGGLGAGLIGALTIVLAAGLPSGSLLEWLAGVVVLFALAILITAIGLWVGTAVGVLLFLRSRGFVEPARTALPTAVFLPVWATLLLFLISRLPSIDLPGIVGLLVLIVVAALVIVVPALAGRALFRFRTTGGI